MAVDTRAACLPSQFFLWNVYLLYIIITIFLSKLDSQGQQQQPPPEAVTTPLASVQEEKEETEWPNGQPEEHKEPQENGKLLEMTWVNSTR